MLTAARLGAAALAGLLLAGAATPALADSRASAPAELPAGLYGKGSPVDDGVWRQSLALIALTGVEVVPADSSVSWLTDQQCADGGWPTFRADTTTACDPTSEDGNATAMAIEAMVTLGGHHDRAVKGVDWLKAHQNQDGSWSRHPGSPGEADSTALAVSSLLATGTDPATVAANGRSAYDGLAAFQLGCASPTDQRGAFAYQPSPDGALAPNTSASAEAALAAAGGFLPVTTTDRSDSAPKPPACPDGSTERNVPHSGAAEAASAYLAAQLTAGGQHLWLSTTDSTPAPDFNSTAWAVLGLVQAGHPKQAANAADWLADNGYSWAAQGKDGTDPSAAATMLMAARAARLDPYNFGGANYVQLLINIGPTPNSVPTAVSDHAASEPEATKAPGSGITEPDDNSGFSPGWLIGIGVAVAIGGGFLFSLNRRQGAHQPRP